MEVVKQHQISVDKGDCHTPIMIFPEGCTSRESEMIDFKIGAFCTLSSVQPMEIKWDGVWGITPMAVNARVYTTYFISCCMPPFGVIRHKRYPVFKPNQYFWDKYWEPVKEE